jgi:hypothetical protein
MGVCMAKNYKLIPEEKNNWEVATFLLIDHIHPRILAGNKFSRASLCTSSNGIDFIYKLLGPIGYEVNKTLVNSIASAVSTAVKKGYLECHDGECQLTKTGYSRMHGLKTRYSEVSKPTPIGEKQLEARRIWAEEAVLDIINSSK